MDRAVKPGLYADAGIRAYLRIELGDDGPVGHLNVLAGGAYREVARGATNTLTDPYTVTLDLGALDR